MLHANFMALSSVELSLFPIKLLYYVNREFRAFSPVTLTLTQ